MNKAGGETRRFYVWLSEDRLDVRAMWLAHTPITLNKATDCTDMDDAQFESFVFGLEANAGQDNR